MLVLGQLRLQCSVHSTIQADRKLLFEVGQTYFCFSIFCWEMIMFLTVRVSKQVIYQIWRRELGPSRRVEQQKSEKKNLHWQYFPNHHFQSFPNPTDFINLILSNPYLNITSFSTLTICTNYTAHLVMP